ncbi:hypothetical protein P153DRAFT_254745, partial [Dothidotthia symphoricarpi CBS 119687]
PVLANSLVLVFLDTESWESDHTILTEIGISTADSRHLHAVKEPGCHGEDLLKTFYYYHARIEENAHLLNVKYCPGDPEKNRFGRTRFLNKSEAREFLKGVFNYLIDATQPELGFCPVVVVGHALHNDLEQLSSTLNFDAKVLETVVKTIDTQQLSRECDYWSDRNPIGLKTLVAQCGYQYRDPHTALNDAVMTKICAVEMVMPDKLKSKDVKPLQVVVDQLEEHSHQQSW